jgi:hypothetical protein
MRCPYCGGLNQDKALFCMSCGRDIKRTQPNGQAPRQPAQAPQRPAQSATQAAYPQPAARQVSAPAQTSAQASRQASNRRQPTSAGAAPALAPLAPVAPPEPEPPVPFPPRTLAQFEALLAAGSQAYTLAESHIENGQRKVVTIVYPRCAGWQQAATLLKALRENQEERYTTIIVRGQIAQQQDIYGFTNGQLQFDRNVLLGSRVGKRYVLETGNGYAIDSLRFVLNE